MGSNSAPHCLRQRTGSLPALFGPACNPEQRHGPFKLCHLWFYRQLCTMAQEKLGRCTSLLPNAHVACASGWGLRLRGTLLSKSQPALLSWDRPPDLRLWTLVWWEGAAPSSASWALCTASWPQFPHQLGGDTLATLQEVMYEEGSGRVEYVICTCENLLFLLGNCQQGVFPQRGERWGLSVCSLLQKHPDQLVRNSG